ncbi:MAG: cupin domain-containing protein [Elusimicrobia bacterium]|nr:cupin domain-containing protein [Elusimicrobiota bacterium]
MKRSRLAPLASFEKRTFSGLSIRFLNLLEGWPVSVAHETIPAKEAGLPFIVHERTREFVYVLGGAGRVCLGNRSSGVAAGDCLAIEPGVAHRFVTGGEALTALSVFSPPMTFDNLDATACRVRKKKRG